MIKAGFIGTGNISAVHLRYLASRRDVRIAALCDVNPENLARRHAEFGGATFSDFRAMLKAAPLDAVWLCTPPQVRQEPLAACARLGIPVFCEKPVARELPAARRTAAALQRLDAKVMVGYVFRCLPIVRGLVEAKRDDQIHLVRSFYGCGVSLSRSLPAWFYRKELSGGALVDQATHNLDLLRMLMGEVRTVCGVAANPVHAKSAGYTIDEVIALSFLFASGAAGGHAHTWVGDAWRNEIVLVGRKRVYRLNLGEGTLGVEAGAESRTVRQDQARMYEHENACFLEMVASGDWSRNPCSFAEGAASLDLTLRCDAAISGAAGTVRPRRVGARQR